VGLSLFADNDLCAQAIRDLQIQRIGAVYDLSAGRQVLNLLSEANSALTEEVKRNFMRVY